MNIIDFHAHVYPEKIAKKATESTCEFYNLKTSQTGTVEGLLEKGEQAGIMKHVLLPVAIRPDQIRSINDFIINAVKLHKEFYGFGTLHADMDDPIAEIEYIKASGLKGIKLHPDIQQFPMDDRRLFPVYDYLQGNLPVLIHCGDKRHNYSHPERLKKILKEFPGLKVIAAHLGGWSIFEEGYRLLKKESVFFDISSCMMFLPKEDMKKYILAYGPERILFGTDYPLWEPKKEVDSFLSLGLKYSDEERILYKNALQILQEDESL